MGWVEIEVEVFYVLGLRLRLRSVELVFGVEQFKSKHVKVFVLELYSCVKD